MAIINDPRKVFNFGIQFAGLDEILCQELTLPDTDIEPVEHGEFNHLVKTGGLIKFGMLTMDKMSSAVGIENWVWDWQKLIQNARTGSGALPSQYFRAGSVLQFAPNNVTVIAAYDFLDAWPSKINGIELSRTKSENVIERIELCVRVFDKVF